MSICCRFVVTQFSPGDKIYFQSITLVIYFDVRMRQIIVTVVDDVADTGHQRHCTGEPLRCIHHGDSERRRVYILFSLFNSHYIITTRTCTIYYLNCDMDLILERFLEMQFSCDCLSSLADR